MEFLLKDRRAPHLCPSPSAAGAVNLMKSPLVKTWMDTFGEGRQGQKGDGVYLIIYQWTEVVQVR